MCIDNKNPQCVACETGAVLLSNQNICVNNTVIPNCVAYNGESC